MNPAWLVVPPLLPLGMALVNTLTWPRSFPRRPLPPVASEAPRERISALVPARNEAANIGPCVRALLVAEVDEVWVYDDGSTDETPAILAALVAEDALSGGPRRLHVLRGEGPPEGWVGKAYACDQLALASTGDLLLFVDADVHVSPRLRDRLCDPLDGALAGVDAVTAVPRQETGSLVEHLVVPLLHLTYESWLPLTLVERVRTALVTAANGQLIAMRRPVYVASGGYAAVRNAVVDDMALCRHLKRRGFRVRMADGHTLAACRMYRSGAEVIDGFSKNLYPGIGGTPLALAAVGVLYTACFLLPWLALPFAPVPAVVGIGANLVQRLLLAVRHRHHPLAVLLHPVAVLLFLGIALRSAWLTVGGRSRWRGRALGTGKPDRTMADETAAAQTWGWSLRETRRVWLRGFAGWYVRWRAGASLDGVWVSGLDDARAAVARGPVIFTANHVSWWDGLLMLLVDAALDVDGRVIVLGDSVQRMPFLRWIGAIPLAPEVGGAAALAIAARHLDGPRRVVWIFPQGRQRPTGVRPLGFARGMELLVRRSGATVVPVALDYPFRSVHVPAAVISFGAPLPQEAKSAPDAERAVTHGLDGILRWADGGRDHAGFAPLLPSRIQAIEARGGARVLALGRAAILVVGFLPGFANAETSSAPSPTGRWTLEMVVATRALIPVLGATRAEVRSVLDVTIEAGPDGLVQSQRVCTSQLVDRGRLVKTVLPEAFVRALPVARFPITLTPDASGWAYEADFGAQSVGWTGEGALPRDAAAPSVVDWDNDGQPGATVRIQAPIVGTGVVYVVQQGRTLVSGRFGADGSISGSVTVVGFGQQVIGASSALLEHAPTIEQDPARSSFRMSRVAPDVPVGCG